MSDKIKKVAVRFGRSAVSVVAAGVAANYGNSPWWLLLSPALQAFGKFLREQWGVKNVPF